jgi:hypothetical protein
LWDPGNNPSSIPFESLSLLHKDSLGSVMCNSLVPSSLVIQFFCILSSFFLNISYSQF